MAKDAIVFACANPVPEIWPWEAKQAGARIVASGRSDFSNQVNNSLGFPAIFRGVIDVAASTITDEMCIADAEELARCAEIKGLSEEHILPTMDEWEIYPRQAAAVALKAMEQGVAKKLSTKSALIENATRIIRRSQEQTKLLMREGIIAPAA
jgi:malate dehydrogenase (oxaloacetate-decarboxylating)